MTAKRQTPQQVIENLASSFRKNGIRHDRVIATYLLEEGIVWKRRYGETSFWFTKNTVHYDHSTYKISQAQDDLIAAGYMKRAGREGKEANQFVPTNKLIKAINKYEAAMKSEVTEVVLEHEVRILEAEQQIRALQDGQQALWDAIRKIHEHSPPVTPAKLEAHLRLVSGTEGQ